MLLKLISHSVFIERCCCCKGGTDKHKNCWTEGKKGENKNGMNKEGENANNKENKVLFRKDFQQIIALRNHNKI